MPGDDLSGLLRALYNPLRRNSVRYLSGNRGNHAMLANLPFSLLHALDNRGFVTRS